MATPQPSIANGAVITFKGGEGATILARLLSWTWNGPTRVITPADQMDDSTPVTKLVSNNYDPGSLDVTYQFDGALNAETVIVAALETTFKFQFPGSTPNDWTVDGAAESISFSGALNGVIEGSVTIQLSGALTTN